MCICELCHFEVEQDDIALARANGHCICVRCYCREAGVEHLMPKALLREIESCLVTASTTGAGA